MTSARTDEERAVGGGYLPALDGMRAIAIAGVFALHIYRPLFPGGAFGVDVFFVLSAYLITSILLRELTQRGTINYSGFYWRRVFRLGPALVLWLALIAFPTAVVNHTSAQVPWSTTGALFYFNDFLEGLTPHVAAAYDQSWSLAVEEQFYLLWPLLLSLLITRTKPQTQRASMVLLVACSAVVWLTVGNYFLPTGHLLALSLGCWAAFWSVDALKEKGTRSLQSSWVAVPCIAVFGLATFYAPGGIKGDMMYLAVVLSATVLTLHCVVAPRSRVSELLGSRLPRWVGARSYGMYLYGLTMMGLIPAVLRLPLHYAGPLDIIATYLVVMLSYRFIEVPIRTRGRNWLATRNRSRAVSVSFGG